MESLACETPVVYPVASPPGLNPPTAAEMPSSSRKAAPSPPAIGSSKPEEVTGVSPPAHSDGSRWRGARADRWQRSTGACAAAPPKPDARPRSKSRERERRLTVPPDRSTAAAIDNTPARAAPHDHPLPVTSTVMIDTRHCQVENDRPNQVQLIDPARMTMPVTQCACAPISVYQRVADAGLDAPAPVAPHAFSSGRRVVLTRRLRQFFDKLPLSPGHRRCKHYHDCSVSQAPFVFG